MPIEFFTFENVAYSYQKSNPALTGVSLSIFQGEKVAVLGANGSGKSTVLKLLDGIIFAEKGKVAAFGQSLTERELNRNPYQFREKVGFVFQDSDAQLFCSSVYDEVAFAPLQLGLTQEEVILRVNQTLQDFGLWELKDRPPYQLSGGEKKKVALASVLIYDPEVLLLDEPTNGLDPRTKKWFFERLLELNGAGTTIVIATHDLEAARLLTDRAIVMNERHGIEKIGPTADLLNDRSLLSQVNLI